MRFLLGVLLSGVMLAAQAAPREPAEVAVLAALHRMHAEVPAYPASALEAAILRLDPAVLCIEVRPDRFAQRAQEANKIEYPEVVYPLLRARPYRVYPMETDSPRFEDILGPYMAASRAFSETQPRAAAAFSDYGKAMYAALRAYWTSPARVNDAVTDQHMRAKHALQEALGGEGERAGWDAWNRQFLAVIERAAGESPGKRIVVVVGAEHGYWLREHLAHSPGIRLLDTAALLAE